MGFFESLESRVSQIDSPLCVGLDPRVPLDSIVDANRRLIEATLSYAACYKPNIAFYEQHGPRGLDALAETIAAIPAGIPILLDAKRGDIGATAQAYAAAVTRLGVGAVTVSPYMGQDSVQPFIDAGLAVFVLCRTSNPGHDEFQSSLVGGTPFYLHVAGQTARWDGEVGLVVAGNDQVGLAAVRRVRPDAWFLAPGVGAQGGSMDEAVRAGLRSDGLGLLPVVARGIADAEDSARAASDYVDAFRRARDASRTAASAAGAGTAPAETLRESPRRPGTSRIAVMDAILATGCFQTGSFTLKSGIVSPFYIDLRRLQSSPNALEVAASAYAELLQGVGSGAMHTELDATVDRLAGIPVAALPLATALSLRVRLPLIYPRLPPKPHGTGNRIEGEWKRGERVVLVDDLITTGLSKIEAASVLREDGLIVDDLIVLVERGGAASGREELAEAGLRVHAAVSIADLVDRAVERGTVAAPEAQQIRAFLEKPA